MQQNDDVIPDTGLPIERRKRDGMVVKEIHRPHGRFYEGHVASDPNSHVAVRENAKKSQLVNYANRKICHFLKIFQRFFFFLRFKVQSLIPRKESEGKRLQT